MTINKQTLFKKHVWQITSQSTKTSRHGMTLLQITNVTHQKSNETSKTTIFGKENKEPKLSINLVVPLFVSIYVYKCLDMCNINLT